MSEVVKRLNMVTGRPNICTSTQTHSMTTSHRVPHGRVTRWVVPRDRIELSTPAFSGRKENTINQPHRRKKA
jgi:hypothetical protein